MSEQNNRALIPFTNEHFAAFCLKMVGQPYWMGTCLYKASNSLLSRKTAQYPSSYTAVRKAQYQRDVASNRVVADCIGAAKGYAWTDGGQGVLESIGTGKSITSKYGSNGCPDKGANSMFTYAKGKGCRWGAISTLPEIVGLALHKSGHVGYYVGNGYAVEWKGFAYGCVKTKVAGRGWTHWYELPFIKYGEISTTQPDTPNAPDVSVADTSVVRKLFYKTPMQTGADVQQLQAKLNSLGFDCGTADGIFGKKTRAGVKAFQAAHNLEVDGIVGKNTRSALEKAVQSLAEQGSTSGMEAQPEQDEHAQGTTEAGKGQTSTDVIPSTDEAPITIRIKMTRAENTAVYGTNEVSLDIEEYLRGVVPSEMYESANVEALKAQAIAARTYAYRRRSSLLSDTANNQAFRASRIGNSPHSDESVSSTKGQVLTYNGKIIDCFYSASNKGQTKRSGDVWSTHYPYYVTKPDEWDETAREGQNVTSFGHGVGMSQHGAMWAARHGVSHQAILAFYYEGCTITDNYNT